MLGKFNSWSVHFFICKFYSCLWGFPLTFSRLLLQTTLFTLLPWFWAMGIRNPYSTEGFMTHTGILLPSLRLLFHVLLLLNFVSSQNLFIPWSFSLNRPDLPALTIMPRIAFRFAIRWPPIYSTTSPIVHQMDFRFQILRLFSDISKRKTCSCCTLV